MNKKQIYESINDNKRIKGVIEIDFNGEIYTRHLDDKLMGEHLVGKKYGRFLSGFRYKLVGCNTFNQTLLIEVDADAESLLFDSDVAS